MAWCPFATHIPLSNPNQRQRERRYGQPKAFCMHIQDGYGILTEWFNNPNGSGPTHFQILRTGEIIQFADTNRCVWANGWDGQTTKSTSVTRAWSYRANDYTISCEYEEQYDPVTGTFVNPMTEAAVKSAARLIAWCATVHGWGEVKYLTNLFRHYHFTAKACDANIWPEQRIIQLINQGDLPRPTIASTRKFWGLEDEVKWRDYIYLKWKYAIELANNVNPNLTGEDLWACVWDNTIRADLVAAGLLDAANGWNNYWDS